MIVGMLSTKCGQQMALVDNYKLQVQQERSKCSKHRAVAEQLESLRHEMSELKGERATLCDVIAVSKQQLQQLSADNASLHQIISDASQVLIRTLQPAAREDCAETSIDVASKRENVLEQLLTILNSDNLRQPTSDDRPHEEGNASGARQHVLQPATELSSLRRYEPGDLGFIPRANERLCSRVDSMRWMSASLSHQMVGRLISRSAATQTPSSWSQSTHRH